MKYSNLFYFRTINSIGGIESWYNYIAKLYNKYDITIVCNNADLTQLKRLRENVRVLIWDGNQRFECERLFINFNRDILDYCKADEVIFYAHGNYEDMVERNQISREIVLDIGNDNRITRRVGISQSVCNGWFKVTGQELELCYNPISLDKEAKLIRLCVAQRMTKEKGVDRISALIKELEDYCFRTGNYYHLDIYSDSCSINGSNNVTIMKPDININRIYGYYDWFISLTDEEGYCYSAVEALLRGTPIIATPCKVFKEIGLNESNSIFFDFDCSNVKQVVQYIYDHKPKFKFNPPESKMIDFLVKNKSTYEGTESMRIKATKNFFDLQRKVDVKIDDVFDTDDTRAEQLIKNGFAIRLENIKQERKNKKNV